MCHNAQLFFIFIFCIFSRDGFLHVGQAPDQHELATSGDPPALASQGAGVTGVSHRTWPTSFVTYPHLSLATYTGKAEA